MPNRARGGFMKSANAIRMDYNAMLQKASSLENLAGELNRIADSIDAGRGQVALSWSGLASAEYQKKLAREKDLVRRRARQLSQSAQGVRKAAKRLYDTEMFALSLLGRH